MATRERKRRKNMEPVHKWYSDHYSPSANWDGVHTRSIYVGTCGGDDGNDFVDVYIRAPAEAHSYGSVVFGDEPGEYETIGSLEVLYRYIIRTRTKNWNVKGAKFGEFSIIDRFVRSGDFVRWEQKHGKDRDR
jgi:hypothetical protein